MLIKKSIKDIDKTDPIKQVQELPIIKSCRENEDCQEIQTADNQYYVNNITDKNNETIDLKIVYGGYKLPEVKRDNYVFGGWGLNKPKTNGVISDEELETLEILGYQTLDGDSATFDGEYAYATEYELTDNQILHAVWWEIPYVEKVSFNFKDTMDPETGRVVATSEIEPSLNHADGFYVKIPNNPAYFVDVFSLNVVTSTAVKLNTKAIPDEDYFDLYHNGKGLPIEFLTHIDLPFENKSGDHKTYSTSLPDETEDPIIKLIKQFLKGGQMNQMFAAPTFLYILMGVGGGGATLGGGATVYKNIGVADKFACNGLACSEHYISTGVDLFGDSYVFVATEEAMEDSYTVKYMIGDEEVYSIELPRGAKIPEISTDELTVYEFDPETGMRGDEIAKYNVSDWSYSSSYADGENRTITIEGIGTKQISLEGIKIDMTATINEPSIEKEEEPTISGE